MHLEYLKDDTEKPSPPIFSLLPEIYFNEEFFSENYAGRYSENHWPASSVCLPLIQNRADMSTTVNISARPTGTSAANRADMRNTGLRAHFYTLEQSFNREPKYELEKITAPTLIIHGEKDSHGAAPKREHHVRKNNKCRVCQHAKHSTTASVTTPCRKCPRRLKNLSKKTKMLY